MDKELFLETFRESLKAISNIRYLASERAYQSALFSELKTKGKIEQIFSRYAIIEPEYQKTLTAHGITNRPDIIIHVPFETGINDNRASDNYVVIQLKLKASESKAEKDFGDLDLMFEKLNYQTGIFLNIDSLKTFVNCYKGKYKEQLNCFAVKLVEGQVIINEQ